MTWAKMTRAIWRRGTGKTLAFSCALFVFAACSSGDEAHDFGPDLTTPLPEPSCDPASDGGSDEIAEPQLLTVLSDRWHEGWLSSPAVADINDDGQKEIIMGRASRVYGWHADGEVAFMHEVEGGRIWSSPVVADLDPSRPGLEVAVAARDRIYVWDASGELLPGFPVTWRDELRALAAGDITGDGRLELVAVTTNALDEEGQRDIVIAFRVEDAGVVDGFPPNTTGASGCDDRCYVWGGFDQTLALGDVTGDGRMEIFAPQDNAYMSLHDGTGRAFDAADEFEDRKKFMGIRFLHDYDQARQGWPSEPETMNQAHFTNSAPAIVDVTGDGNNELVVLGSVQNASQTDRYRGVALWVLRPDGSRPQNWHRPFHVPEYLSGLWDLSGANIVAATNSVAVADLDPDRPGPQFVFAGFDGRIHAVDAEAEKMWRHTYTQSPDVLTGGVVIADLSGNGVPEVVFATYSSTDEHAGHLFILDAGGNRHHAIDLPDRGAMPVPTIADVTGDGTLEIVVSLKDARDGTDQVLIYTVPGSSTNCLLWPTGRGNFLRNGFVASSPDTF